MVAHYPCHSVLCHVPTHALAQSALPLPPPPPLHPPPHCTPHHCPTKSWAIHTAVFSLRENVTANTPLLMEAETFTASCWASGRLML